MSKQTASTHYVESLKMTPSETVKLRQRLHDPSTPLDEKVEIAERLAGRTLRTSERIVNELQRHDDRPIIDRIAAENWRPTMPAPKEDGLPFASEIAAAEAKAREEIFARNMANMTAAEKEVYTLKQMQANEVRERAEQAALDAERAKRKPMVDALEALQAKMKLDPLFTLADQIAVEQALAQCLTPGSCDAESKRLFDVAMGVDARVNDELLGALRGKLTEAQRELLDAQIALGIKPQVEAEQPTFNADGKKIGWYIDDPEYVKLREYQNGQEYAALDQKGKNAIWAQVDAIKAGYVDPA